MKSTELIYLENFRQTEAEATVVDIVEEDDKTIVYLDGTIFYPQGGGQPYDKGTIESTNGKFIVDEVRYLEGLVKHIGSFEKGQFAKGEKVKCLVDVERRELHSRLHSAGHLVDMAVEESGLEWIPGKGFHFPDGPYVEYEGNADDVQRNELPAKLEEICNKHIAESIEVEVKFVAKDKLKEICKNVPTNIPEGKPTRVVMFGTFGVPCGGTHVENLKDLKHEIIRKIKNDGTSVRVAYDVDR
ncbi:hypothetical protein HY024_00860 [Candidatus Curtissbacteria bacterium]|nr:hypothetical protein [Candidatus Curtissbacteria bacterium]